MAPFTNTAASASNEILTGAQARSAARRDLHTTSTAGLAPGYLQANLIILPSRYADDFRNLCARNPVPCPLIAESASKGSYNAFKSYINGLDGSGVVGEGCDLRRDAPRYMVYKDSKLAKAQCSNITAEWTDDHVGFLIGCSYSFETELTAAGLPPRQVVQDRNVPMYRTTIPLCPAGVFTGGTYVVSMRPYKKRDIERVRDITRRFGATHGEPLDWGWEAVKRLGIRDIDRPEWGHGPLDVTGERPFGSVEGEQHEYGDDAEIPVFWGCGVTPQEAVMKAGLEGVVMGHAPGHMLVLDAKDEHVVS